MTAPVQTSPDPADLWDYLVSKGLSKADATRHVMLMLQNQPAEVRRQYLKDVDPGKLASFGLGMADMLSFGLGDQIARKIEGQEATDTQQASKQEHPTARLAGQIAGVITPLGAEMALEKAGIKLVPSALRVAARGVQSIGRRAAAKTAVNAIEGAAYAAAQAAGHKEGSLGERARAAGQAAPLGAAVGVALPWLAGAAGAAAKKVLGPVVERVAGKAPPVPAPNVSLLENMAAHQGPAGGPLQDLAEAMADRQAGRITQEEFNTAMQAAGRGRNLGLGASEPLPLAPAPTNTPPLTTRPRLPAVQSTEPLDVPTFMRRGQPAVPGRPDLGTLVEASPTQTAGSNLRTASPSPPNGLPMAQLKMLMQLPEADFNAATALFPEEIIAQLRVLRQGLLIR